MLSDHVEMLAHNFLESRKLSRWTIASRPKLQLEPFFIVLVTGQPEACGLRGMNQHRDSHFSRKSPNRIDSRIVHGDTSSI